MGEAKKHDEGKPAMELLVPEFLLGLGEVMEYGKHKYGRENWKQGLDKDRIYGALQRHANQYHTGEKIDPDSKLPHILLIGANVMMLFWYEYVREQSMPRIHLAGNQGHD